MPGIVSEQLSVKYQTCNNELPILKDFQRENKYALANYNINIMQGKDNSKVC